MQQWLYELIQNFIIGGTVIAGVSYLATFLDPVLAAMVWAFPISLIPSMYYMYKQGKDFNHISRFAIVTTYALIVLFFTTYAIGYYFEHETSSFWIPVLKGITAWIILSTIYYFLIKFFNLDKKFV